MAILASDNFDRADGDSLGANWTEDVGDWDIETNRAKATNSARARWSGSFSPASADYDVQGIVDVAGGSVGGCAVAGRYADSSNYYSVMINTFAQAIIIKKRVAGSETDLGSSTQGYSNNNAYSIKLTMNGTTLKAFEPFSTERVSVTDSSLSAAGVPGIISDSANRFVNDFEVNGTAAGGAGIPNKIYQLRQSIHRSNSY